MANINLNPEVLDFIVWMSEQDVQLTRAGCYNLGYDQLEVAWIDSRSGVDSFAELDLLCVGRHGCETYQALLSDAEMVLAARIEAGESVWTEHAPDWLLDAMDRTRIFRSYKRRRYEANRHIQRREVRERIFSRDGYACVHCGAVDFLAIDHIIAVANGGTNEDDNLQTLCISCNSSKGAK